MVNPLVPAAGLLKSLLPIGSSLLPRLPDVPGFLSQLTSLLGGLLGGGGSADATSDAAAVEEEEEKDSKEPGPKEDEAVLAQILMRDPVLREALRKEVDRRLHDDVPEDVETTTQLERLRDLLKKFESAPAEAPEGGEVPAPAAGVERALASLQELSDREGWTPPAPLDAPSVTKQPGSFVTTEGAYLESLPPLPMPPPAATPAAMVMEQLLTAPPLLPPAPALAAAAAVVAKDALLPSADADLPLAGPAGAASVAGTGRGVSTEPGGADPADLVERIVRAAKLTQSRGVARLRLVLTPPELGELRLDLSVRQKTLHATLQADRVSAAEAILAQLPALKEALEKQGFDLGGFSVSADGAFAQAQEDSGREPGEREPGGAPEEPVAAAEPPASLGPQLMDLKA